MRARMQKRYCADSQTFSSINNRFQMLNSAWIQFNSIQQKIRSLPGVYVLRHPWSFTNWCENRKEIHLCILYHVCLGRYSVTFCHLLTPQCNNKWLGEGCGWSKLSIFSVLSPRFASLPSPWAVSDKTPACLLQRQLLKVHKALRIQTMQGLDAQNGIGKYLS